MRAACVARPRKTGDDVATTHQTSETILRGARMLRTALGPAIARFLEDPAIVEVMLNPDGRLWIDRLSEGLSDTGERLSAADGERIVRLVAHHVGAPHSRKPGRIIDPCARSVGPGEITILKSVANAPEERKRIVLLYQ